MSFERKPLFDRVIIEEIPIETYYDNSSHEGVIVDLDNTHIKLRSDRGKVVAVGDCVPMWGVILPMPVKVGDIVFFDDTAYYDPVFLNPSHRYRTDLPKYWQIRVGDLKGIAVEETNVA